LEFVRIHFHQLTEPIATDALVDGSLGLTSPLSPQLTSLAPTPRFLPATSPRACGDPNR
jgi:hypothetical protein